MIWNSLAEVSTGNSLLDSAWYVFGAGAFLLGALVVAILYLRDMVAKRDKKIESQDLKIESLQDARLQDQKDFAKQQSAPLDELKNFVGALYEQSNNRTKGQ